MREATLAVTYRCNARCSMCNIWKETSHNEIAPSDFGKLPKTLRTINITGGEPFIRNDLVDIVRVISSNSPRARIVFSTNGFLTEKIVKAMTEIREFHPNIGVGVSIDGMEETHDEIRGVPGIFQKAMSTIGQLKENGISDLRLGMTIVPTNISEVPQVFQLSKDISVEFTTTTAHNSEIYFKKTDNVRPEGSTECIRVIEGIVNSQLRSRSVKDWFRAYHTSGIFDSSIRKDFISHCQAGMRYFFMAPNGDIYPCNVLDAKMGNILEVNNWNELFNEEMARRTESLVRSCRRDCWMVCNTRSLIMAHPVKVCTWILRNKIFGVKNA